MSKTYSVTLGGQERRLKFTIDDAVTLGREFKEELKGRSLNAFMFEDVLGFASVDDPDVKDKKGYAWVNQFNPRARIAVLGLALRRGGTKASDAHVSDWLDAHADNGGNILALVMPAVFAAYYGGAITGARIDIEETLKELAAHLGIGDDEGKDQSPAETKPPAIPAAE